MFFSSQRKKPFTPYQYFGHVLPFFPEYQFAYRAIAGGKYGRLTGGHFKRIISDPLWLPRFYDPAVIDLHVHDAHFIRLVCGMPRAVQGAGRMRGEVVERFQSQFLFDDPGLIVTAASGVIPQQGRPFTHGYEIYLERATLLYDFAVIGGEASLLMPVTVLTADGKVVRPKLPAGDAIAPFAAELGELARDAVILCQKQTQSIATGRTVKV